MNIYFLPKNSQNASCNHGLHTYILLNLSRLLNLYIPQLYNEPSSVIFGQILVKILMKHRLEGDIMQKEEVYCPIMVLTIPYCKIKADN